MSVRQGPLSTDRETAVPKADGGPETAAGRAGASAGRQPAGTPPVCRPVFVKRSQWSIIITVREERVVKIDNQLPSPWP